MGRVAVNSPPTTRKKLLKFFKRIKNIIKKISIKKSIKELKAFLHHISEEAKIKILRWWLVVAGGIARTWFGLRRFFFKGATFSTMLFFGYFLYLHHEKISGKLISLNTDSSGANSGLYSNIFIALGASIIGVIAITFSLSLFAIQQAADKHTPSVLQGFLKDRTNRNIFWCIVAIALIFFAFAVFPLDKIIFYEVIAAFVLLVLTFMLVQKQYRHVTKLVNPNYQIIFHHNEAIKGLERIDKWLDLMIRIRATQPGPSNEGSDKDENAERR